jgi:two-component system sensor histidine kinase/response regulator
MPMPDRETLELPMVLLVDDDISVLEGVADLMEINGYEIWTAENGQQALELMQTRSPDMIISDIMMPVMDGYEFYERVRSNPSWIPIPFIFLSARSQPVDVRRGRELGVDEYIVKPFDPQDLLVIIDNRWRRTQEIRRATMESVERVKKQIVDVMGHELRTPLAYIYGYINLLRDERAIMAEQDLAEMMASVERGAERMKRLVDDLLFLVKLDGGVLQDEFRLGLREYNLAEVVRCVVVDTAHLAELNKIVIHVDAPTELRLTGMRVYVRDILTRLVDNGIKFTNPGTGSVTIRVYEEDGFARIDVIDDGIGIHPDDHKRIFQRFQQINREDIEQQGTGLGLSIARELLVLMGGDIWVTSALGEGSTFSVSLPLEPTIP